MSVSRNSSVLMYRRQPDDICHCCPTPPCIGGFDERIVHIDVGFVPSYYLKVAMKISPTINQSTLLVGQAAAYPNVMQTLRYPRFDNSCAVVHVPGTSIPSFALRAQQSLVV
jgi:hypothetical protein